VGFGWVGWARWQKPAPPQPIHLKKGSAASLRAARHGPHALSRPPLALAAAVAAPRGVQLVERERGHDILPPGLHPLPAAAGVCGPRAGRRHAPSLHPAAGGAGGAGAGLRTCGEGREGQGVCKDWSGEWGRQLVRTHGCTVLRQPAGRLGELPKRAVPLLALVQVLRISPLRRPPPKKQQKQRTRTHKHPHPPIHPHSHPRAVPVLLREDLVRRGALPRRGCAGYAPARALVRRPARRPYAAGPATTCHRLCCHMPPPSPPCAAPPGMRSCGGAANRSRRTAACGGPRRGRLLWPGRLPRPSLALAGRRRQPVPPVLPRSRTAAPRTTCLTPATTRTPPRPTARPWTCGRRCSCSGRRCPPKSRCAFARVCACVCLRGRWGGGGECLAALSGESQGGPW
jgi:hypothetical protein